MGRVARTSTGTGQRDEWRLRELDRRQSTLSATADASARGIVGIDPRTTPHGPFAGAGGINRAASHVAVAASAQLLAGRRYAIGWAGLVGPTDGAASLVDAWLQATTDGSDPTTSSPQLQAARILSEGFNNPCTLIIGCTYAPAVDLLLRVLGSWHGRSAAQTYTWYADPTAPSELTITDMGADTRGQVQLP